MKKGRPKRVVPDADFAGLRSSPGYMCRRRRPTAFRRRSRRPRAAKCFGLASPGSRRVQAAGNKLPSTGLGVWPGRRCTRYCFSRFHLEETVPVVCGSGRTGQSRSLFGTGPSLRPCSIDRRSWGAPAECRSGQWLDSASPPELGWEWTRRWAFPEVSALELTTGWSRW